MKYLIIGLGSIGSRHLKNLAIIDKQAKFVVYRSSDKKSNYLDEIQKESCVKVLTDLDKALAEEPDACIICNPTYLHIETARNVFARCKNILIEKPISDSMNGVDELLTDVKKHKGIVFVAYNMRWHPMVKRVKKILDSGKLGKIHFARLEAGQYLPDWRKVDYKNVYSSKKALGGGVVLDLSHEIDTAYWFFGKPKEVAGHIAKVSKLDIDTEDIAEITMKYKDMVCQVHLDYLRKKAKRTMDIIGDKGSLYADLITQKITLFDEIIDLSHKDANEMYIEELKHFIDCIKKSSQPDITLEDGKVVLDICLKAKKTSK